MTIALIGCPFRTTYGHYYEALTQALKRSGRRAEWIASNCGCTDPIELARNFQTRDLHYFELPNDIGGYSMISYSPETWRRMAKAPFRQASLGYRVSRYASLAADADVIHLQQTLNAFGSSVAFRLLRLPLKGARVVTIHELDPEQSAHPELNRAYNLADAIIVHDSLMKRRLASQGVSEDLIHVVCMGTDLADFDDDGARDGIAFYGGHHLNKGKGFQTLLEAISHLEQNLKLPAPTLRVHGHFGPTPSEFLNLVSRMGLEARVEWLGDLPNEEIAALYRRSQVCVLPYTASFAGLPVGIAAASRLPVVATRYAGIPDHIGDLAIWIDADSPVKLAKALQDVLTVQGMRPDLGRRLRAHAEHFLGWDKIAGDTIAVYEAARERASARIARDLGSGVRAGAEGVAVTN